MFAYKVNLSHIKRATIDNGDFAITIHLTDGNVHVLTHDTPFDNTLNDKLIDINEIEIMEKGVDDQWNWENYINFNLQELLENLEIPFTFVRNKKRNK